jgi:mitochondrial fission protein ELM1
MRSIHVGFPRVSPAHFDLVITTPQYPVPDQPNVLQLPFALTRTATNTRDAALDPDLERLPGPRRLLIVGGPTLFWNLEPTKVRTKLGQLIEEARQEGGSVIVTTSPRTPPQVGSELKIMLGRSKISALFAAPGQQHSYASLLAAATSIHVTADSVSMISDAIWTRKPMAVVPITPSPMGSLVLGLHDLLKPGSRIYPQDLRFFWRALAEMGVSEQLALPRTSAGEVLEKVMRRFRAIPSGSSHSVLTL